jgi:myo-inositol 2-dehydrogenase / D-chiro-inositol 1-dehydrogenase
LLPREENLTLMSLSNRRIRVGLIGAGRMGQLRAPILYANPRIEFVCVVEKLEQLGNPLAAKYGVVYSESLSNAVNSGCKLDAICLSTPTFTHKAVIEEAASMGLHIFTEKPVGESTDDIAACFEICREHNAKLCCGFQRRFDASYVALKESIASGSVGKPMMINVFFADHRK